MGTNYYLCEQQPEPCDCCGHTPERAEIHLGKASYGWTFAYRGNRDADTGPTVETRTHWLENIYHHTRQGWMIYDEYGSVITVPELNLLIERHREGKNHARIYGTMDTAWLDEEGNAFLGVDFS